MGTTLDEIQKTLAEAISATVGLYFVLGNDSRNDVAFIRPVDQNKPTAFVYVTDPNSDDKDKGEFERCSELMVKVLTKRTPENEKMIIELADHSAEKSIYECLDMACANMDAEMTTTGLKSGGPPFGDTPFRIAVEFVVWVRWNEA